MMNRSFVRMHFGIVWLHCCLLATAALAIEPPITAVAFAPGGKSVFAVSQSGLQEFRWPDLTLERTIQTSASNLHCLSFSLDQSQLAVGGGNPAEDGSVEVFSWPKGEPISNLSGHRDSVKSIVWQSNSSLISASIDREIRFWNLTSDPEIQDTYTGHSRSVDAVCLLSDGKTLVSAGVDQSLRVWDVESGELVRSLSQHTKPVHAIALSPAENGLPMIASAAADRTIRFWQPTIGRMVRYVRLEVEPLGITWLDDVYLAVSCVDGHVRVVDTQEVIVTQDLPVIEGWAYSIAKHPLTNDVVVGGSDGQLRKVNFALGDK